MEHTFRDRSNKLSSIKTFYGPYANNATQLPKHILKIAQMLNGKKMSLARALKIFEAASYSLKKEFAVEVSAVSKKQYGPPHHHKSMPENYIALEIVAKGESDEKHFWKLISYI